MSQENVEMVRRAFEAWYPNDSQVFADSLDPEFEYCVTYGPEEGIYRGWRATIDAFDLWQEVFSEYQWWPTEFIDAGDDHVIVPFVEKGFGRTSGVKIEQQRTFLCTITAGRILRITEYPTTADALAAVGLRD